jgi:hypothetical protein
MTKLSRALVACLALAALVAVVPAQAASPSGGTLSKSRKTLKWKGGPYTLPYPTTDFDCLQGESDPQCDHYILKINMGQGARIDVTVVADSSGLEALQSAAMGFGPNDVDLSVYDPNGDQVGTSGSGGGTERVTFTHKAKFRNKPYEIRVVPYLLIPGSGYAGTIKTLKFVK